MPSYVLMCKDDTATLPEAHARHTLFLAAASHGLWRCENAKLILTVGGASVCSMTAGTVERTPSYSEEHPPPARSTSRKSRTSYTDAGGVALWRVLVWLPACV